MASLEKICRRCGRPRPASEEFCPFCAIPPVLMRPRPVNQFVAEPASRAVEGPCGQFHHCFGGELARPVIPPGGQAPCHLLYLIDTEDPLFPVRVPGVRYLPLLYCQQYNAAGMHYRVSQHDVKVLSIESLDWADDFPYDNYPRSFPRRDIRLERLAEPEIKLLDRYLDLYETDPRDWSAIDVCKKQLKRLDYPFTQFGGRQLMWQGIPEVDCANPACHGSALDVFGVIWNVPVKEVYLWEPGPEYCEAQIIYQICRKCFAIHVCNRCT